VIEFLLSLGRDKKKLAIAAIALAFFLYADFSFGIGGQINYLKDLNKKITQRSKEIETLKTDIAYVQQKKTPVAGSPVVVKTLPQEKDIPALLQHISGLAGANGIRVMQIDSTKEAQKAEKTVKKPAVTKDKKNPKKVSAAPSVNLPIVKIKLDVVGGYHKLGSFINALENSDKFCFVDELMIGRDPAEPLREKINLVIKTYVKK